jgi:hypothetical protein
MNDDSIKRKKDVQNANQEKGDGHGEACNKIDFGMLQLSCV